MKRYLYILLVLLLTNLASCDFQALGQIDGSGNIVKKSFVVQDFNKIELDTIGDVYIEQGNADSLTIETDDNILALLEARTDGDTLLLREDDIGHNFKPSSKLIYTITVRDLTKVTANASGNIHAATLKADNFFVMSTGSGSVTIASVTAPQLWIESDGSGPVSIDHLKASNVQANARGSGTIKLVGTADILQIITNGSGDVLAGNLHSSQGDVSIHGSGDALVWVDDTLHVAINGSGNGSYYGEPAITKSITGSGKVQSLGKK